MERPVKVPNEIFKALEEIRRSGVDMSDYQMVLLAADSNPAAKQWLGNNMKIYLQSLIYGISSENEIN